MANEEHLAILRQGVEVWNRWRKDNPEVTPLLSRADLSSTDFRGANLSKADLGSADFHSANLSEANISSADFRGANLSEAKLSEAYLSRVYLIGADLSSADFHSANLSEAHLSYADFRGANLSKADLNSADFHGANLSEAKLSYADFRGADLSEAKFNYADLSGADLSEAKLSGTILNFANLSYADLSYADLRYAQLRGAILTEAHFGWTVLCNVDLSEIEGLETTSHKGPSSIGIDTIYKSKGNIPYKFLLDAGVPKDDIPYLLSLAGKAIDFYSCFISYSSPDKAFAERLHADLQAKGVRCWYAPEDLTIGEPILSGIDKGIRLHDKLLLVLSTDSVNSRWVEHEVEAALAEELRPDRKAKMLFPIRLDNAVMETNVDWAYRIRQTRNIGDFIQWKEHDAYQKAFDRLLRDLKLET